MESSARPRNTEPGDRSARVSTALIPIGIIALFSFGAQVVFAPFVLVVEWILARVARGPVKIAWSLLAGVLAGEFVYMFIDLRTEYGGFLAVVAGLGVATIVAFVYLATTGARRSNGEAPVT